MEDELASALAADGEEISQDQDGSEFVDEGIESAIDVGSNEWLPSAIFDVLVLTRELGRHGGPGRMDIHTFAYLACLMSVFRGAPASDWTYSFTAVPPTLPYSPTIDAALSALMAAGKLTQAVGGSEDDISLAYKLTAEGELDLELLRSLISLAPRLPYLEAAAKTSIFTSLHAVVNSLSFESQIAQALSLNRPRLLLSEMTSGPLYEEFDALARVLGPAHRELLVPASLYVTFLQTRARDLNRKLTAGTDSDE